MELFKIVSNNVVKNSRQEKPDRYEIIGSVVAVIGAVIIFYSPR